MLKQTSQEKLEILNEMLTNCDELEYELEQKKQRGSLFLTAWIIDWLQEFWYDYCQKNQDEIFRILKKYNKLSDVIWLTNTRKFYKVIKSH